MDVQSVYSLADTGPKTLKKTRALNITLFYYVQGHTLVSLYFLS